MPNTQQSAQPTQPQAPAQQKKSNIILTIIGWIMGVVIIILGFASFSDGVLPGIIFLVLGSFILPPISKKIRSLLKWEKKKFIVAKIIVIVILVILSIIATGLSEPIKNLSTNTSNANKSTGTKEELSQEEFDAKLKSEVKDISFVELYGYPEKYKDVRIYKEGEVVSGINKRSSTLGMLETFMLKTKEEESNGAYIVNVLSSEDILNVKEGDRVRVWGFFNGMEIIDRETEAPNIMANIVELVSLSKVEEIQPVKEVEEKPKEETNINQATNTNQKEEIKLDITQPQWGEIVKAPQVELRGKVEPQDAAITVNGNRAGVAPDGSFGIMIDLKEVGDVKIEIIARKGELESKKDAYVIRLLTPEEEKEESEASLKAEAETIPFKELYRNIEQNTGKKIHYRGKVVQVMGSTIRVNITKGSYGIWEDTVLVEILDTDIPKILEDDLIEFWGTVTGEESYTAVLGQTISLPAISAEIVEIIE